MSIKIVGGGPAGLFTGINLLEKGFDVVVYDKKSKIGYPQHCTGIISPKTLRLYNLSESMITTRLYGISIHIENEIFSARSTVPKAYVIDRVRFEKELLKQFNAKGGRVVLNKTVMTVHEGDIDARGSWVYAKYNRKGVLPALQLDYECGDKDLELENGFAHIYIDKKLNKDFFIWMIPIKDAYVRIGTASTNNLPRILSKVYSQFLDGCRERVRYYGLIIHGGPLKRFNYGGVLLVGDSAGQAKPTTGGGLYYLGIASKILSRKVYEGEKDYSSEFYHELGKEIKLQKLARKIFLMLKNEDIHDILLILSKKNMLDIMVNFGDMDLHVSSLLSLLSRDILKLIVKDRRILREVIKIYL